MPSDLYSAESLRFPGSFLWGASTSAYQTEGGNSASDLWEWERRRGWEASGKASNSFEMWEQDLGLIEGLGLNVHRFSVEWGRVMPSEGKVDRSALEHYRRLAQRLLDSGILPIVCLHHFTQPRWLFQKYPSLWADPGVVEAFVRFADILSGELPVSHWIPFNEPMVFLAQGYLTGYFPPGLRWVLRPARAFLGGPVRNMAEAHRRVYALIKGKNREARIGVAQNISAVEPLRGEKDSRAASLWDEFFHWAFLDALAWGCLDADLDGERETVLGEGSALDFIGVNYYTRVLVRELPFGLSPLRALPLYPEMSQVRWLSALRAFLGGARAPHAKDDMGREIYPEGLAQVLRKVHGRYGLPMLVTENGVADSTGSLRELYILSHLAHLRSVVEEGLPVSGYLHWSLLDNYEWGSFAPRFGLYRVAYEDGFRRELTPGGRLYGEIVRRSRSA